MVEATPTKVFLLHDERMQLHHPIGWNSNMTMEDAGFVYERPGRIAAIYNRLIDLEQRLRFRDIPKVPASTPQENVKTLNNFGHRRFIPIDSDFCERSTIELVHSPKHYEMIRRTCVLSDSELEALGIDDLYFCHNTFHASSLACGGVVKCVNAVTASQKAGANVPSRAIALVRPPGHHATREEAMGELW